MEATIKHTSERNGCMIKVYEYRYHGKQRFGATVTNLTTGNSEQTPGWTMYKTALEVAQQTADAAQV